MAILRVVGIKRPKLYVLKDGSSPDSNYKFLALDIPPNTIAVIYGISTYKNPQGADSNGIKLYQQVKDLLGNRIIEDSAYECGRKITALNAAMPVNCYVLPADTGNYQKFIQHTKFDFFKYYSRANFSSGAVALKLAPKKNIGQLFLAVQNPFENGDANVMIEAVAITDVDRHKPSDGIFASDTSNHDLAIFSFGIPPKFNGNVSQYLSSTIRYPIRERDNGIQGRVGIDFIVRADGQVDSLTYIKRTYTGLDQEAMRVIAIMPLWQPGREGGEAVNVHFKIPITFKLD